MKAQALSLPIICTQPATLSTEQAGYQAKATCTDNAGNTSAEVSSAPVNLDKTAPTFTRVVTPGPNADGWNNTDVTVTFTQGTHARIVFTGDPAPDRPEVLVPLAREGVLDEDLLEDGDDGDDSSGSGAVNDDAELVAAAVTIV